MKRNTLILVAIAVVLGVVVYFLEFREGKPPEEESESSKPAFEFKREDVVSLRVTRGEETILVEEREGKWIITEPVNAPADEPAVTSLIDSLTGARIERTLAVAPDQLATYGLAEPAVSIQITLKSGEQRSVQLGSKDFSGLSVYARLNDGEEVALLGSSVLTGSDKSLADLRDTSVLGLSQFEIASLDLSNEHGRISLAREENKWMLKSPVAATADDGEVSSMLSSMTSAKATEVAAEAAEDLANYGLNKPSITVTVRVQTGGERVLSIGEKDDAYYAKTSDRPQVFKVDSILYDNLNKKTFDLRDKRIADIDEDALQRVEIRNPNLRLVAEKGEEDKWVIREPEDQKDKELRTYKVLDPIENEKATEIYDRAPANAASRLAKASVELRLTGKDGSETVILVSTAEGESVYVQVKGRPQVFKVAKRVLEDLSFKIDDAVM